jgi:hypothetical protein
MKALALAALALAACGSSGSNPADLAVPDLAAPQFLLSGTYAAEIQADLISDGGGGTLSIATLFKTFFTPSSDGTTATLSTNWEPCAVSLPGGLRVPYAYVLEPLQVSQAAAGTLSGKGDGAHWTGQPVTLPIGYCSTNPATDPVPAAGTAACPAHTVDQTNPCSIAGGARPCLFQTTDANGTHPGVPVTVSGMTPDADVLYVAARATFSVEGSLSLGGGEVNGTSTSGAIDWTVVACHLRAGGDCTPTQIAQLNAQRSAGELGGGIFRSHAQPAYYTCPLFNADVPDALTTFDPLDGGVNIDLGAASLSFANIEQDIERMGCATCHDRINGPGKLHLVYKPWSPELMRLNWQNLLPWTVPSTAGGLEGGRFVNGPAPVPPVMKQRWRSWISAGAPY